MAYSFLDVSASMTGPGGVALFGGLQGGVAEEGISIRPEGQKNTMTIGAGGTVMNSLRAAKNGLIIVRLLKTSPQNPVLGAMYDAQTISSTLWGTNIIVVTHPSGEVVTCRSCAFRNPPEMVWATNGNVLEWEIEAGLIDRVFGSYT